MATLVGARRSRSCALVTGTPPAPVTRLVDEEDALAAPPEGSAARPVGSAAETMGRAGALGAQALMSNIQNPSAIGIAGRV